MDTSLQTCFQQFQIKRNQNFLFRKYVKKDDIDRTSNEWQNYLRSKFVAQAKKYLGVPYHSRYHSEDSPHFNAPLYLDCSGLVRQVIYDLREDFGFTLGKWNQAYQFDLLDKPIPFNDMQIGDLIFYSGTFYSKNERVFQHNIVHVEIYLGQDEKTIAARHPTGVVAEFASYKFESQRYYDVQHHFKSIRPWLEGRYESFCTEHPWRDDRNIWVSEKYSVFSKVQIENQDPAKQAKKRRIYVGQGNNAELIKSYFRSKEEYELMDTVSDAFRNDYFLKWVQCPTSINYYEFKPGQQLINHIPKASYNLGMKIPMLELLKEYNCHHLLPKTYRLDQITEVIAFLQDPEEGVWIVKPYNLNCGRGIKFINDVKQFKQDLNVRKQYQIGDYYKTFIEDERNKLKKEILERLGSVEENNQIEQNQTLLKYEEINPLSIVQKYIERPLLLEDRKFDIRCYALIPRVDPYTVLFHEGYARLSISKYTLEGIEDAENKAVHLTNAAVQKMHPQYKENKQSTIWSMERWEGYLLERFSKEQLDKCRQSMKESAKLIFQCGKQKIVKHGQVGEFELFGLDFLIDAELKVYFLEANINPALFTENPSLKDIIPKVVHQTLDIVLAIREGRQFDIGSFEQLI